MQFKFILKRFKTFAKIFRRPKAFFRLFKRSKKAPKSPLLLFVLGIFLFSILLSLLFLDLLGRTRQTKTDLVIVNQTDNLISKPDLASIANEQIKSEILPRLIIPKIKVAASLEHIGLTAGGAMGVPSDPLKATWFDLGPRPGEIGNAVIAGHYGLRKNGQGSVFDNLHKLVKGDEIYIEDKNASTTIFIVREIRSYNPNDDASSVFVSNDGRAHLNLITCEGIYNRASKSYPKRLVVFADLE